MALWSLFALSVLAGCATHAPLRDASFTPPPGDGPSPLPGDSPREDVSPRGATARDGVYTEEQSLRGRAIFLATCAPCHRPDLSGSQIVPALSGDEFVERWSRKTVGDLFEKVRSMPPLPVAKPSQREYADVLAFILGSNRFPSGQRELDADFSDLAAIRMTGTSGN